MVLYAAPACAASLNNRPPAGAGGRLVLSRPGRSVARTRLLVLVGDVLELGIDDMIAATLGSMALVRGRSRTGVARGTRPTGLALRLQRLVHRLAELHRRLAERVGLVLDVLDILGLQGFLQPLERTLDLGLLGRAHLVAEVLQ